MLQNFSFFLAIKSNLRSGICCCFFVILVVISIVLIIKTNYFTYEILRRTSILYKNLVYGSQ
jgi:hypothetical protein